MGREIIITAVMITLDGRTKNAIMQTTVANLSTQTHYVGCF